MVIFKNFRTLCRLISAFSLIVATFSCLNIDNSRVYFEKKIDTQLREIKTAAKNYCISIGLDFDSNDPIRTEMYHRCNIELIKQAKVKDPLQPYQIYYNRDLSKFIEAENRKLDRATENLNDYRNNILDIVSDHKECIKRGYDNSIFDADKMESYYHCRKSLISSFLVDSKNYQPVQNSYSVKFAINKKQDQELINQKQFAKSYPLCSKLRYQSNEAKKCKLDFDKNNNCKQNNRKKSIILKMKMNKECQEKLYSKLPDSLLIKDKDSSEKYNKKNYLTDLYLNPSLYDFLKNEKTKASFEAKKEKDEENVKKEEDLINNKNTQIYNKKELVSLRRQYIIGCTSLIDDKITSYIERFDRTCDSEIIKWKNKK